MLYSFMKKIEKKKLYDAFLMQGDNQCWEI